MKAAVASEKQTLAQIAARRRSYGVDTNGGALRCRWRRL
jgi:hypothetical protein